MSEKNIQPVFTEERCSVAMTPKATGIFQKFKNAAPETERLQ